MALSYEDSIKAVQEESEESSAVSVASYSLNSGDDAISAYSLADEGWILQPGSPYYPEYSDDNISTINDVKGVIVNDKQINITQEKNSQFIPFEMNRYYDGYDLIQTTIQIYYVNADNQDAIANAINIYYNSSKIRFGWLVDDFATAKAGKLKFEIQAIGVNSKGEGYIWKTRPNDSLNVIQSLSANGSIVKPSDDWITSFLTQVQEQVATAQSYAYDAQASADEAEGYAGDAAASAMQAQSTVDAAKTELTDAVQTAVDTKVDTALVNYYQKSDVYTKTEVDNAIEAIDISDELAGVIADTDSKIAVVQGDLDSYKEAVNADLEGIHSDIDGLPEALRSDYYTKTDSDDKFATKTELNSTNTNVSGLSADVTSNKSNITALSTKVGQLEEAVNSIDTSPSLTYDAVYNDKDDPDVGENVFVLYEITNEGKENESKEAKAKFTIVGGSGGGSTSTTLKIAYITPSPMIVTTNDKAVIKYLFSGVDSNGDPISGGTATWKVDGRVVASHNVGVGERSFDVTDYLSIGTQKVTLTIIDDSGSLVTKNWSVQKIDVRIDSTFNDKMTYPIGKVSFAYTPYGAISKTVHFMIDGVEIGTVTTSSSGIPMAYELPAQAHGAHLVEVYITADINGNIIESNHIIKDVLWYDASSDVPVISCTQQNFTARQYDANNITYTVYDPSTETPVVKLAVDDEIVSTLTLDNNTNIWQYKSVDVGVHTLTITCGVTVKTITVTVEKLDINTEPVTRGLAFDFNPSGKSNNDADRLWSYEDVTMSVSDNFDWVNGGYQIDENGDQYFCVKAGTSAVINYNLFGDEPKQLGKEFKIIFKTTNVAKSNATFLTCQSVEEPLIGLQMNVHEAYIRSDVKSLYVPYSEEDIIEWEFNISAIDDIPIVMSYEDGTPCRPMSYTKNYSFTQTTPVPITIGSQDCDVMIYRMKAYSNSLTTSEILSNFILDARTAEEMMNRYSRNQIYDENNLLTPESVAEALPHMRVIKIEAPHFTNDKKDYVRDTSMQCIYKDGDPILDNWKFSNCYHAGQGTTSNEYGAAGRNIDVLCCFDGIHQANDKIALDPDYKTELILGYGTNSEVKYSDGTGKVTLTRNSVPNNWWNIKVNIASSEMCNNALLQNRYNTYIPYMTPATRRDPNVKNDMEFVNCVVFIRESDTDITTHREFQDTEWHKIA